MTKSIFTGVAACVIIVLAVSLLRTQVVDGALFADGFREPSILISGVLCGAGAGYISWKNRHDPKD